MIRILVLSLFFGLNAYAGKEGHGGHSIHCTGRAAVVLDYYIAAMDDVDGKTPVTLDVEAPDFARNLEQVLFETVEKFRQSEPARIFEESYLSNKKQIGPVAKWKNANLKETNDLDLPFEIPKDCEIRQAAVRQDGVQFGNKAVIDELSDGQKVILEMHEVLYALLQEHHVSSPVSVRKLIAALLQTGGTSTVTAKGARHNMLYRFLKEMGLAYHWNCSAPCLSDYDRRNLKSNGQSFYPDKALSQMHIFCDKNRGVACLQMSAQKPAVCILPATLENSCRKVDSIVIEKRPEAEKRNL